MVMEKRGQGLSTSTLILIIIGVVILVVLIFGVVAGWGQIKDWVAPSGNVDMVVSACRVACGSNSEYGFCFEKRRVVIDRNMEFSGTCASLFQVFKDKLGVENCGSIEDCGSCEDGFGGVTVGMNEKCSPSEGESAAEFPLSGKKCCVVFDKKVLDKFKVPYS